MKLAEYIVETLEENDIDVVFGYQGGNITYIIDAICNSDKIKYVQNYHEQASSFSANAYSTLTDKFGVAVSSSGPGAANLINGIANAYFDSIPCLFITGNVTSTTERKSDKLRQNAFQEMHIVDLVKDITKFSYHITCADEIIPILQTALREMKQGRSGPVLIDIPHDLQRMELSENKKCITQKEDKDTEMLFRANFSEVYKILKESERPLLLLGGGCQSEITRQKIKEFLEKIQIPVVVSLCGLDLIEHSTPFFFGMIGSYGNNCANKMINQCDSILVLGSRLDERQRTVKEEEFLQGSKIIRVDIDQDQILNLDRQQMVFNMEIADFLSSVLEILPKEPIYNLWENNSLDSYDYVLGEKIYRKIKNLTKTKTTDKVVCVDVGLNQMAVAQAISISEGDRLLNSSGLGAMGYAIPASIGAAYAKNQNKIICFVGDGGFQMNVQELETIKRDGLPVLIVVVNNQQLGMISDYQRKVFSGRLNGSMWGYSVPDIKMIAKAYGLKYLKWDDEVSENEILSIGQGVIELSID